MVGSLCVGRGDFGGTQVGFARHGTFWGCVDGGWAERGLSDTRGGRNQKRSMTRASGRAVGPVHSGRLSVSFNGGRA